MSSCTIAQGDVLDVLRGQADSSFDALFCDPPYGLSFMGKRWDYAVPSVEIWAECLRVLKPGAPLLAYGGPRTFHRMAVNIEDAGFDIRDVLMYLHAKGFPKSSKVGLDAGDGTALKPAYEPLVLARKPLDGTMTENVIAHGVGGLAIDACRVGLREERLLNRGSLTGRSIGGSAFGSAAPQSVVDGGAGRWPANVLLDEGAASILDAEVGTRRSGIAVTRNGGGGKIFLKTNGHGPQPDSGYADSGGPSRFFFTAKVSTKQRELGCESLPLRSAGEMTDRGDGDAALDSPRSGAGRGGGARNHHPTLKDIAANEHFAAWLALDTYVARLVRGARSKRLLVPFAGAGSEIIGALRAGWTEIFGIERESEFVAIARARVVAWSGIQPEVIGEGDVRTERVARDRQISIFDHLERTA